MRWFVLALLLIASPAQAAVLFFSGGETGGLNEFTSGTCVAATSTGFPLSPVHGAYLLDCGTSQTAKTPGGFGATTLYVRFYWSAHQAGANQLVVQFNNAGETTDIRIYATSATRHFYWSHNNATAITTGTFTWALDTWYLLEMKVVVSATVGGVELKVNGTVDFTSLGTNTSDLTAIDHSYLAGSGGTVDTAFDDIFYTTTGYPGAGGSIARQGTSGSPTYTAWTKNSCTGGTIDGCWSETPFTATTPSASSTVLNDAQTMIVHDFASTQTGHGSDVIGNTSTINACKTMMVANAASGGTLTMRRRISGSDTDTAKTVTTTNALYDDGIWTTTPDILRNQTMEIGGKQGANTVTQTIRDMWMTCDFINASQAPKHRVIQQ